MYSNCFSRIDFCFWAINGYSLSDFETRERRWYIPTNRQFRNNVGFGMWSNVINGQNKYILLAFRWGIKLPYYLDTFSFVRTQHSLFWKMFQALRSCDSSINPIYISQGHKLSLETALWVTQICSKHRIPEPTRQVRLHSIINNNNISL